MAEKSRNALGLKVLLTPEKKPFYKSPLQRRMALDPSVWKSSLWNEEWDGNEQPQGGGGDFCTPEPRGTGDENSILRTRFK